MAETAPPQLTKEQAKEAMAEAFKLFEQEDNKAKLKGITEECLKEEDPMKRQLDMMQKLLPAVNEVLRDVVAKYGFNESTLMMAVMQIQMLSVGDEEMQAGVAKIMAFMSGKLDA
eukprot:CAMPEP_0197913202 /NCGR_PEP_ID=MMETSP1439-20131203/76209_1 /TAXON_ID=66791 /ORGANISM="Gonyaulax spinifera, Strain CCMP409" /LENGTH=114 /DNA_ID=CAMNT_0043535039 /DNA_START=71 /DNA_END=415 /DNA_ORIENTATION=-